MYEKAFPVSQDLRFCRIVSDAVPPAFGTMKSAERIRPNDTAMLRGLLLRKKV